MMSVSSACRICNAKLKPDQSQCRQCGYWNIVTPPKKTDNDGTVLLSDSESIEKVDYLSPDSPYAICFGEDPETGETGLPKVAVSLVAGAPGTGKSTLALQMCDVFTSLIHCEALYVAGEEGRAQIRQRAMRLHLSQLNRIRIFSVSSSHNLFSILQTRSPGIVVVDSIQKLAPNPEEAVIISEYFKSYAAQKKCPFLLIGTVNKEEDPSGLMKLQHVVDITSTFLREPESAYDGEELIRVLRVTKNRFGRENVDAYFQMTPRGLLCLGNSDTHQWSQKGPPFFIEPIQ